MLFGKGIMGGRQLMKDMARVLAIDDEEVNLLVLRRILEKEGMLVETALSGLEGLERARSHLPDIVLLDVMMPEMDGITVCRELKAQEATKFIPVVITTAHETGEVRLACLQAGANEFINKPYHHSELVLRVRNLLQLRQAEAIRRQAEILDRTSSALVLKNRELEETLTELKLAQSQILQQEKLASIGQLAAGVAHEINNPMGFISSNLGTLSKYLDRLVEFIGVQETALGDSRTDLTLVSESKGKLKIDYLIQDARDLIDESLDGAARVKAIVQNLKSFSRVDQAEEQLADLNECLETTLNITWNELKYKATVHKEYGDLPLLKCFPQQLNQVFLNLLVNAAQAIDKQGEINIRTWADEETVMVSIADSGCGIPADKLGQIFEPFFTTKPVGKGTGLGLSICYDIIKKHAGKIAVESTEDTGTTFTLTLPRQEEESAQAD